MTWLTDHKTESVWGRDILLPFYKRNKHPYRDAEQLDLNKAIWLTTPSYETSDHHNSGTDRSDYKDSSSKSLLTGDSSNVSLDDQSDSPVVEDQPINLVLDKEVLTRAKSNLEARLKVVNAALKCVEERLDSYAKLG